MVRVQPGSYDFLERSRVTHPPRVRRAGSAADARGVRASVPTLSQKDAYSGWRPSRAARAARLDLHPSAEAAIAAAIPTEEREKKLIR